MERQLSLIDTEPRDWRLDEHTRDVGRRGIAEARRVLAAAQPRPGDDQHPEDQRPGPDGVGRRHAA